MLPLRSAIARRRGSSLRSCFALLACALLGLLASPAGAKPRKHEGSAADPSRWFATRQGLLRVYQARGAKGFRLHAAKDKPVRRAAGRRAG